MDLLKKAAALAAVIKTIFADVLAQNISRQDVIKATFLSLISGRPAFFLGMPGVNKTGTIRGVAQKISGAVFYEAMMPRISSPEELFSEGTYLEEEVGPNGTKKIRPRSVLGLAAKAHIFFGDEIWKGDKRVLNGILEFSKGDGLAHEGKLTPTPLISFLAASNEIPSGESELAADWSRMTIRVEVKPLDRTGKTTLVKARLERQKGKTTTGATLSLADIETLRAARPHVAVSEQIVETVLEIYEKLLKDHPGQFDWLWSDDRRFGRVFDVLQAHALLDGRTTVTKADLAVLEWLLWDTPEQIGTVKAILAPYARTATSEAKETVDTLLAAGGVVDLFVKGQSNKATDALKQFKEAVAELERLKATVSGSEAAEIQTLIDQVKAQQKRAAAAFAGA